MTDGELLSSYAKSGCEKSFEQLVARYLPLVRGVATRGLGESNSGKIDDVAMRVFSLLAERANRLSARDSLAGWLVLAARRTASDWRRQEEGRRRKLNKFAEHRDTLSSPEEEIWRDACPHLDEALATLPEGEREAILLRFYHDLRFKEIGRQLGRGEDAVRKRVGKGLERLAGYLKHRGVVMPVTLIGAGLATQINTAHSAAGAAAVSANALRVAALSSAPASTTGTTLVTMMLSKHLAGLTTGLLFVLCCSSAGYLAGTRSSASSANVRTPSVQLGARIDESRSTGQIGSALDRAVAAMLQLPVEERLDRAVALYSSKRPGAGFEYQRIIQSFNPTECLEAMDRLDSKHSYNSDRHMRIGWKLLEGMSKKNPAWAVTEGGRRFWSGLPFWSKVDRLRNLLEPWATADPKAAKQWLDAEKFSERQRDALFGALIEGTSRSDPEAALELLLELPWEQRKEHRLAVMEDEKLRERLIENTVGIENEMERAEVFARIESALSRDSLQTAVKTFEQMQFTDGDAALRAMGTLMMRLFAQAGREAAALEFAFEHSPPEAHPMLLNRYVREWLKEDPSAAEEWLEDRELTTADVLAASEIFNENSYR